MKNFNRILITLGGLLSIGIGGYLITLGLAPDTWGWFLFVGVVAFLIGGNRL